MEMCIRDRAEGVSCTPPAVTLQQAVNMTFRKTGMSAMAAAFGDDVSVVDVGIDGDVPPVGVLDRKVRRGTGDIAREDAMTRQQVLDAMAAGMEQAARARADGVTALGIGEMGIGNTTTSAAVLAALTGADIEAVTGRGGGLPDEGFLRKKAVLRRIRRIGELAGNRENAFYRSMVPLAQPAILKEIIRGLACDPDNRELLMQIANNEKGKLKETALYALTRIRDPKEMCIRDRISEAMLDFFEQKADPARYRFEIGVQSLNSKTLEAVDRRQDNQRLLEVTSRLLKRGYICHLDLIAGLPYEDRASFEQSYNGLFAVCPSELQVGILKLLKGTAMIARAPGWGMEFEAQTPYTVTKTAWLSEADLAEVERVHLATEKLLNSGRCRACLQSVFAEHPQLSAYALMAQAGARLHALPPPSKRAFYHVG